MSDQRDKEQVHYVPVQIMPDEMDDDEIDLLAMWQTLMDGKWIIIGVLLCCVLGGVGYALLATPEYEVKTYFLPPTVKDVAALQAVSMLVDDNSARYTPETVYDRFLQNLRSRDLQRTFFQQKGVKEVLVTDAQSADPNEVFEKTFHDKLILEKMGGKRSKDKAFYVLSFTGNDSQKTAQWVNGFVGQVMNHTRKQLIDDIMTLKTNQMTYLKNSIAGKRKIGLEEREDRIVRLKEALELARKLHITQDQFAGSDIAPTTANNLEITYLRGTKALEAEIAALQNRKTDDPFIEGLRELQEQLDALNRIDIDADQIKVATIDQPALVPSKPIKPNNLIILAVCGVGGLLLGIFAVFFQNLLKRAKTQEQQAA